MAAEERVAWPSAGVIKKGEPLQLLLVGSLLGYKWSDFSDVPGTTGRLEKKLKLTLPRHPE